MSLENTAAELVNAVGKSGFERLLSKSRMGSGLQLAYALRDHCYKHWANEPTVAQKTSSVLSALYDANPDDEIAAVNLWIKGISDVTKGELESSVVNFQQAHQTFTTLGKTHEAAMTQVAKLIPLGLLGQYERASLVGQEALRAFEDVGDEVAAGKIELNLSNIAARQGKHMEAKSNCAAAAKRFAKAGELRWQAMAENDLAHTLAELNEFEEAEERYSKALEIAEKEEMHLTEAEILASLGNLQTFRGQYGEALRSLELSRRKFERLEMPHQTAIADLEIAEIYQILNLTTEASEIYQRVTKSLEKFKMRGEEARSRANNGKLAIVLGDTETAFAELTVAASLFRKEHNPEGEAAVTLQLARLENSEGKHSEALKLIKKASVIAKDGYFLRLKLETQHLLGETFRLSGQTAEARAIFEKNIVRSVEYENLNSALNGLISLAKIEIAEGDFDKAEQHLLESAGIVENLRAPIPAEEFRMTFLSDKLAPFELLSRVFLEKNELKLAFVYAERARSRTLIENLRTEKSGSGNRSDSEISRLRERLNWFYCRLSDAGIDQTNVREEISNIEKKLGEMRLREESISNASVVTADTVDWSSFSDELQVQLGEERALIEFTLEDDNISAFLVDSQAVRHFEQIASETEVTELVEGLRFQFETLRFGAGEHVDQLKARADNYLKELYDRLILPIEEFLEEKTLIIVPVGPLFYVPFNALFDGGNYLIETRHIITSPSAAVWRNLNSARLSPLKTAAVFAIADEGIPLVEKEADVVASLIEDSRLFKGADATIKNYQDNAGSCDVLHMACHGEFRADNPMYSNLRLSDGFVTVRDVTSQRLSAELVTLSACETGLSRIYAGEEILGLARGFISAGARNLVMSLWAVNDEATEMIMSRFYAELRETGIVAAAMRCAQKELIEEGMHPYFWAPFAIIGR